MDWNKILEKSWNFLAAKRYFLWLGLLIALTEGAGGIFSSFNNDFTPPDIRASSEFSELSALISNWISDHRLEIVIIIAILFLLSIFIVYISYSARAGLIFGTNEHDHEKKSNFHRDFRKGRSFFWRFLGLKLLIFATLLMVFLLLALAFVGIFVLSSSISLWLLLPIFLLLLPAVFGFVLLAIYLVLSSVIAERFIVIKNISIIESIDRSIHLVRANLAQVAIGWLINLLISFISGIAAVVVLVAPSIIFFILGTTAYAFEQYFILLIVIILGFIAISFSMLFIQGFFSAYLSIYWTLIYRKLSKN